MNHRLHSRRTFVRNTAAGVLACGLGAAFSLPRLLAQEGPGGGAGGSVGGRRPRNLLNLPPDFGWHPPDLKIYWRPGISATFKKPFPELLIPPVRRYVSANGSDTNDGTTPGTAFRTMTAARNALQALGGGEIALDGTTVWGWGGLTATVPIHIIGNGSTIKSLGSKALWFSSNFRASNAILDGGEMRVYGPGLSGIVENCVFRNSPGPGLALWGDHSEAGEYLVLNCEAHGNKGDGIAFSSTDDLTPVNVVEAWSWSHDNGDSGTSNSDQGSSSHAGVRSIRIGCVYWNNNNNIADVGVSQNVLVECTGIGSKNGTINLCVGADAGGTVTSWMYGGDFHGDAAWDIDVSAGSVLYTTVDLSGYSITPGSDIRPLDP